MVGAREGSKAKWKGCQEAEWRVALRGPRKRDRYGKKLRSMCNPPPPCERPGAVLEAEGSQAWERGRAGDRYMGVFSRERKEKPGGRWRGAASEGGEWRSRKGVSS